ncbi:MAG: hypothetical protein SGARI_002900 [Bacillariaceae sp.]
MDQDESKARVLFAKETGIEPQAYLAEMQSCVALAEAQERQQSFVHPVVELDGYESMNKSSITKIPVRRGSCLDARHVSK